MVDKKTRMDIESSYTAHVPDKLADKVKKEMFTEKHDDIYDFDLSAGEGEKALKLLKSNPGGDVAVILRNFDQADEDHKKEISIMIKGFWEKRSFSTDLSTDILVTGSESPGMYNGELAGRIVNLK